MIENQGAVEVVKVVRTESEMTIDIGKEFSGDWEYFEEGIKMENDIVVAKGGIVKVSFENDYWKMDISFDSVKLVLRLELRLPKLLRV